MFSEQELYPPRWKNALAEEEEQEEQEEPVSKNNNKEDKTKQGKEGKDKQDFLKQSVLMSDSLLISSTVLESHNDMAFIITLPIESTSSAGNQIIDAPVLLDCGAEGNFMNP